MSIETLSLWYNKAQWYEIIWITLHHITAREFFEHLQKVFKSFDRLMSVTLKELCWLLKGRSCHSWKTCGKLTFNGNQARQIYQEDRSADYSATHTKDRVVLVTLWRVTKLLSATRCTFVFFGTSCRYNCQFYEEVSCSPCSYQVYSPAICAGQ